MGILFVPQTVPGKFKNKWKKTKNQKTPQTNKEIKRGNFLLLQKSLRESHYSHSTAWKRSLQGVRTSVEERSATPAVLNLLKGLWNLGCQRQGRWWYRECALQRFWLWDMWEKAKKRQDRTSLSSSHYRRRVSNWFDMKYKWHLCFTFS